MLLWDITRCVLVREKNPQAGTVSLRNTKFEEPKHRVINQAFLPDTKGQHFKLQIDLSKPAMGLINPTGTINLSGNYVTANTVFNLGPP